MDAYQHHGWREISIHAARVGCDGKRHRTYRLHKNFNPRSPSGLRLRTIRDLTSVQLFQSTQPEWAATDSYVDYPLFGFISIHAARVGCDGEKHNTYNYGDISIHAARVGCDQHYNELIDSIRISIHAARVGCDQNGKPTLYFDREFQSTQPEWAATDTLSDICIRLAISIHAARVGCDKTILPMLAKWYEISIHAARVGCDLYR